MVVRRALAHAKIDIWGAREIVRDFINIADVIAALLALADAPLSQQLSMPHFNFGSGMGCSVNIIVAQVEACIGIPLDARLLQSGPFDVLFSFVDISKAWMATKISLEQRVTQMIDDLRQDSARIFSSR